MGCSLNYGLLDCHLFLGKHVELTYAFSAQPGFWPSHVSTPGDDLLGAMGELCGLGNAFERLVIDTIACKGLAIQ